MRRYYFNPRIDALVAKSFGPNVPSVIELEHRALIALINTNPAIDYAEPLADNVIAVGGLHIKDAKSLPLVSRLGSISRNQKKYHEKK